MEFFTKIVKSIEFYDCLKTYFDSIKIPCGKSKQMLSFGNMGTASAPHAANIYMKGNIAIEQYV